MRQVRMLIKNIIIFPFKLFKRISILSIVDKTKFGKKIKVKSGSRIYNSVLENYSFTGRNCFISDTIIGKYCSISDYVAIGLQNHAMDGFSTYPTLNKPVKNKVTYIGNDVWIGYGSKILAGVKIGTGAIIGAGSIVTKDVPPYAIVVGVPAKIIKYRYSEQDIKQLLSTEWWNLKLKEAKLFKFNAQEDK